ncbi:MAG: NADH-quinone oxidoreductase subunit L, partial [Candidatus Marsarchaeota archaeon]|nr:NADH-quinone oxidoreductase subunit L [Candidatus Marsarchaeota archaeon]
VRTWMQVEGFAPQIALYLDALSVVMILVVTVVGFLIHLYSAEYMIEEEGYSRFFAYMNMFVGSMLVLVLADNLVFLYLGWEGVGLCSYLLIGFWYKDAANGRAAIKAFIVTRIGDTAMAIGLFFLFTNLGTLQIQELMHRALEQWPVGSTAAIAAAALILGGALGKSAQLPLQTWLPDAMAGPTPVSALIHAATMVTAGVYLIARTNVLFTLAPPVQFAVAIIGCATLLIAGFSAMTQFDIKRVLAYSTISQIGYMFLALGVGAWSSAMFHFVTHAFFKALLFLSAGVVIMGLHEERNMFKMGGLRKQLPVTFWTFLVGAASLSALPLVTGGFYSKDPILWEAWSSPIGGFWLGMGGLVGVLVTSIYSFRMVFLTFFGEPKATVTKRPTSVIRIPLIVLAILSVIIGFIELPHTLGNVRIFSDFMNTALPAVEMAKAAPAAEAVFEIVCAVTSLIGIYIAYIFFLRRRRYVNDLATHGAAASAHRLWFSGWGFDWLYGKLFVDPFVWVARANSSDVTDLIYRGLASLAQVLHGILSVTQSGIL